MSFALAADFLLWSAIVNYGVLLLWFLVFVLAHDWMLRLHGLVPYVALRIVIG